MARKPIAGERLTNRLNSELTLLHRHLGMLEIIKLNEPVGINKLAELAKLPQHKVRYTLKVLEQERLIKPTIAGAVTTQELRSFVAALRATLSNAERSIAHLKGVVDEFEIRLKKPS